MGVGDRYARLGREGGYVAAGWDELGALDDLPDADDASALADLVERFERATGTTGAAARVGAGQVWRFLHEMGAGDLVLLPNLGEGMLHIGRIEGDATWLEPPTDGCRLPRRRAVTWMRDVPVGDVPNLIRRTLDGTEPLANLDGQLAAIRDLTSGKDVGAGGGEAALLARVVESLYALPLESFPGVPARLLRRRGLRRGGPAREK